MGQKWRVERDLLMQTVLCRNIDMWSQDMHSWSTGKPFPGLPRNKKLSHSPPPNQNMLPLHMPPRRLFGSANLLVKFSSRLPIQFHFIQTHKPPSHSPMTGLITLAPNTLISSIILFDSSLIMGPLILFIVLLMTWSPTHLPRCFPTSKWSISHFHSAYNWLEGGVLEYSRSIKPTAKHTANVLFPYLVYKYVLPIFHWTWHYITITNSQVLPLQLLGMHWLTHTYLLTIIIVIYLVYSLFLALTIAWVAHTIIYLHIYFVYLLQNPYHILLSHLHSCHHKAGTHNTHSNTPTH